MILKLIGIALLVYYVFWVGSYTYKLFKAVMEGTKERKNNG
jgi:hypothetical protein